MNALTIPWVLIVTGALLILLEVVLGAAMGFDFLLIGSAILVGGVLGMAGEFISLHHRPLGIQSRDRAVANRLGNQRDECTRPDRSVA